MSVFSVCGFGDFSLMLFRCGVVTTKSKLSVLWARLLKNKDSTVNFQQFIKEFTRPLHEGELSFLMLALLTHLLGVLSRRLTEDHCFMRSRTLHRDEDMILEKLRHKFVNYQDTLFNYFKAVDLSQSGYITLQTFQVCC